jgi:fibronectin type 3 domain-containing protein
VPPQTAPANLRVVGGLRQTSVSWDAVAGADRYRVFRSSAKGGTYSPLKTVVAQNYDDAVAQDSAVVFYRVAAANAAGDGPLSDEVSATTSPAWGATAAARIGGIDLSWPAHPAASQYQAQCLGGVPQASASAFPLSTTSVSFSNLPEATLFRCDVLALDARFSAIATSTLHVTTLRRAPGEVINFFLHASQVRVAMEWLPTSGANAYVISRGDTQYATVFTDIAQVTDTSYFDFTVQPWTRYSYQVRAVNETGDGPTSFPFPIAVFGNPTLFNLGPVDASPLSVTTTQTGGQTISAPISGQLMGFEVSITEAGSLAGTDLMTLSVFRAFSPVPLAVTSHSPVATYKVPFPPFRGIPGDLSATDIGAGYYDFSNSAVLVTEGDPLRFILSDDAVFFDDQETGLLGHTADQYPFGNALQSGSDRPGDLVFKLFINPTPGTAASVSQ